MKKNSGFLKRNIFLILLILLTVYTGVLYYLDNQNKVDVIKVEVDKNKIVKDQSQTQEINIFVYNPQTKTIDPKMIQVEKQRNFIEGDYMQEIFKLSPFVTKGMEFQSAYKIDDNGKKKEIIKLSSDFKKLRANPELFNGFIQSVAATIQQNDGSIEIVDVQIDGEAIVQ